MANATELVSKLNFVLSARHLVGNQYIEEFPPLPQSGAQEEEIMADLMFAYLKKKFPGCRIRKNQHSYSLRLDSHIHRKANKLRDIIQNETEWKNWFEQNHNRLYRTIRDSRNAFPNGYVVRREERNGNTFLYVPFKANRIYNFMNSGLIDFMNWVDQEYNKDSRLVAIYDEVMRLMEAEIQRRETERLERIRRELEDYKANMMRNLFKPVTSLQESADPLDRLFAQKFIEWARENGKAPEYAVAAGAREMIPTGLKVKVMAPSGSEEEGWVALPPFDGYQEPEGYELQGWGKVTSIDMTGDRSRNGQSPIVIQDYIYAEFHLEYWKHLIPEGHAELLEATQLIRQQAEAEIEPFLEQERIRKEREEAEEAARREAERLRLEEERLIREEQIRREMEEERQRQEARRVARELRERAEREERERIEEQYRLEQEEEARRREAARERMDALAAQLRQQLADNPPVPVEAEPQARPTETFAEMVRRLNAEAGLTTEQPAAEPTPEPERATAFGVYRNDIAIPLERYVAIKDDGTTRRFRNQYDAISFLDLETEDSVEVHDYHAPFTVVDVWYNEDFIDVDDDYEDGDHY